MNACCALQHFCDIHGPQILVFTEVQPYVQNSDNTDGEDLKTIYSQYIKSENPQDKPECKSCTLSPEHTLVSSIDSTNHMLFISTASSTLNKKLFKDIRNACVRSLNIEKSVDTDSPILFGDDENGYCLSLAFSCKDFYARGGQRLYSLCYLCDDKYHLLSLMKILSESIRQAVHWLQNDANLIYQQEGQIKINSNLNGTKAISYVLRPPPSTPLQRMLSDVTNDSKITLRIHALFVWLLRIANSTITELLFHALPTEEQTTKNERKDDEYHTNSITKRRTSTFLVTSLFHEQENSLAVSATLTHTIQNMSYLENLSNVTNGLYQQSENSLYDADDYDSLEYQFSSYGYDALQLFELFVKKLNNTKYLQYILHNWSIGNRLIIKYTNRTDNRDLIREIASVFRLFLPDGCCHIIQATGQTIPCTTNFILFDTDSLTDDILSTIKQNTNDNNLIVIRLIFDDIEDSLRVVKLETLPPTKLEPPTTYVKHLLDIIADANLNEEIFETMIEFYKIKYLNKAKLYFQLGRCQAAVELASNERQQMAIFNLENRNDLLLIKFWQQGLSQSYKSQIRALKQDDNQQKRLQKQRQQ